MDEVYIKATSLPKWEVEKFFKNKDLIGIDDLIACIEELDAETERLNDKIHDLKNQDEDFDPYSEYGVDENWFH